MKKLIVIVAAVFALWAPINAQAASWAVDGSKSKLGFFATQLGAEFEGGFKSFVSRIVFDPADLTNSVVEIDIDIASVGTQNAERDANITKPEWFNASEFPRSFFKTQTISQTTQGQYVAVAELTMRGITKKVELPFQVQINDGEATARGELTIKRTDFGIGQGQWAAGTVIGDDVRIFFDLSANAQ